MSIQCRISLSCAKNHVVYLLACLALANATDQADGDSSNPVFDWLKEDHDNFYFNPKLKIEDGMIQVQEPLDESEVLMKIPSSAIMSVPHPEDGYVEDMFCELAEQLLEEVLAGDDSDFEPYIQHIQHKHAKEPTIPNFWSNTGKNLFKIVYGDFLSTQNVLDWIDDFESCQESLSLDGLDNKVFDSYGGDRTVQWTTELQNSKRHALAITAQTQIDQRLFVPLYDQLPHHHLAFNVKHIIEEDDSVTVIAREKISPGEVLYRPSQACLFECVEPLLLGEDFDGQYHTVLDIVRNFGYVPSYPNFWEMPNMGVSFTIDDVNKDGDKPLLALKWKERPFAESQVTALNSAHQKLQKMYEFEVLRSIDTAPVEEWKVIEEYCTKLSSALNLAIQESMTIVDSSSEGMGNDAEEGIQIKVEQGEQECKSPEGKCIADESNGSESVDQNGEKEDDDDDDENDDEEDEDGIDKDWDPWSITKKNCSDCDMEEIRQSKGCDNYFYTTTHNQTTWIHMRAIYVASMGAKNASIGVTYGSGMKVPYKIGYSPGRGRGVFAMDDIPMGALVWRGEHTAAFSTGEQFRRFLNLLPDVLVCDLLNWCYTSMDENQTSFVECDLDEGSLINSFEVEEEYTVGCYKEIVENFPNDCFDNIFALRDIEKGEELVTSYDEFSTATWADFGL